MCRSMIGLLTALAVVLAPSYLAAEEGKRPQGQHQGAHRKGPSPERMFQRLDANQDKVITADELPADMPKQFKAMLIRADGNKDGKLTIDELKKSFKHRRDGHKAHAGKKGPPQKKHAKKCDAGKEGKHPKHFKGKDHKQFAKMIFVRLDKDKNGSLCFKEFSHGLRQFHKMCVAKGFKGHKAKKPGCKTKCHVKAKAKCHVKGKAKCHMKGKAKYHKKGFAKKHHPKGHKFHAKGHKSHGRQMYAKCHHCRCCMGQGMGPGKHHGMMQRGMGPWMHPGMMHPGMMQRGMGPWGHPGMAWGMNPWQHHGMQYGMQWGMGPQQHHGMNPWQGQFPKQNWGKGFPAGPKPMMHRPQGGKKNQWQMPKVKKPRGKAPRMGDSNDQRIMQIEARLTNLEQRQEAMLVAIQEQQAAMMAALQRTNELVGARLASLGSSEEPVRPTWDEDQPEGNVKVIARVYNVPDQPEEPDDQDRE